VTTEQTPTDNAANGAKVLTKLVSQLNVPTLVAILAMNGWGIKTTEQTSKERETQIYHALDQIRDLHRSLDDFESRQKKTVDMLENQQRLLDDMRKWQQNFKNTNL
jgi:hypothetical protein